MSTELEYMNLDLESVDLTTPLFKGPVLWRISSCKEDQKQGKFKHLVIGLTLEAATTDTTGRTVNPGFKHTDHILLEETGKYTKASIAEKIARLQCAAFQTERAKNGVPWSDYEGRLVIALMDVQADRQNPSIQRQEVKRYVREVAKAS